MLNSLLSKNGKTLTVGRVVTLEIDFYNGRGFYVGKIETIGNVKALRAMEYMGESYHAVWANNGRVYYMRSTDLTAL